MNLNRIIVYRSSRQMWKKNKSVNERSGMPKCQCWNTFQRTEGERAEKACKMWVGPRDGCCVIVVHSVALAVPVVEIRVSALLYQHRCFD